MGEEPDVIVIDFDLSALDPIDTISGLQTRLRNIGYFWEVTGSMDASTRSAIALFQSETGLKITGEADRKTRDMLEKEHDE